METINKNVFYNYNMRERERKNTFNIVQLLITSIKQTLMIYFNKKHTKRTFDTRNNNNNNFTLNSGNLIICRTTIVAGQPHFFDGVFG